MKRIIVLILAVIMTLLLVAGCSAPAAQSSQAVSSGAQPSASVSAKKIKIGIALATTIDIFDRTLFEGIKKYEAANSAKLETIIMDAKGDTVAQLANVEQLINANVDVIILWPLEEEALTVATEKANAANIPVVCVNTTTTGGKYVFVGSDNVQSGTIQGEWLTKNLPQNSKYCYLVGPQGHSAVVGRKQGLQETFVKDRPDAKKLAEQTAAWDRAKALTIAEDWLKTFPDVNVIIAQSDSMALGAIEALRTAGKLKDVIVVSIDATEEACQKIKEGEMAMSVFQNADAQGQKSMEVAYKIAMKTWTGGDFVIPYEAVDKTNVDEYMQKYYSTSK